MRRLRPLVPLALAAALAAAPGCRVVNPPVAEPGPAAADPAAVAPTPADREAIVAALQASAEAWNRADLDAHLAPYAEGATFMTGSGPAKGKARTRELLSSAFWSGGRPAQQLRFERLDVRALGPDHALSTGNFILSGGGRPDQTGWFSLTWGRTPAGWRILHDHSS